MKMYRQTPTKMSASSYPCPNCSKSVTTENYMKRHMKTTCKNKPSEEPEPAPTSAPASASASAPTDHECTDEDCECDTDGRHPLGIDPNLDIPEMLADMTRAFGHFLEGKPSLNIKKTTFEHLVLFLQFVLASVIISRNPCVKMP